VAIDGAHCSSRSSKIGHVHSTDRPDHQADHRLRIGSNSRVNQSIQREISSSWNSGDRSHHLAMCRLLATASMRSGDGGGQVVGFHRLGHRAALADGAARRDEALAQQGWSSSELICSAASRAFRPAAACR